MRGLPAHAPTMRWLSSGSMTRRLADVKTRSITSRTRPDGPCALRAVARDVMATMYER